MLCVPCTVIWMRMERKFRDRIETFKIVVVEKNGENKMDWWSERCRSSNKRKIEHIYVFTNRGRKTG